jgi:predicted amidohydrolase YtcJ
MQIEADLIVMDAEVYSVDAEGELQISEAFGVKDGKFIFVGDNRMAAVYKGDDTKVLEVPGRTVLPGLADSHSHNSSTVEIINGFQLYGLEESKGADTRQGLIQIYQSVIAEYAKTHPDEEILRGVGWNPAVFQTFPDGLPTAIDIDAVCANRPVMIRSYDHHFLWINTLAMKQAGITKDTEDPYKGIVVKNAGGNPTGVLQEFSGINLFIENHPLGDYSVEEYMEGIRHYQDDFALPYGTLLSFDALPSENAKEAYKELAKRGELKMRFRACHIVDPSKPMDQVDRIISSMRTDSDQTGGLFRIDTVKFFIDGEIPMILLNEPYLPRWLKLMNLPEGYKGEAQWDFEDLKQVFLRFNKAGIQIHAHCIGDATSKMILDAFEYVAEQGYGLDCRNTMTHLMFIDEEDIKRMAKLNVIAAMQLVWGTYDSMTEIMYEMFGKTRTDNSYPVGSMIRAGVVISAGTDFPVTVPPNPYQGIQIAVTRSLLKSNGMYETYKDYTMGPEKNPERHKMRLSQAVQAYTINSAYQMFLEKISGTIEVGKSADFVILDRKLTKTEEFIIEDIKAEQVYFKGNEVYIAKKS